MRFIIHATGALSDALACPAHGATAVRAGYVEKYGKKGGVPCQCRLVARVTHAAPDIAAAAFGAMIQKLEG